MLLLLGSSVLRASVAQSSSEWEEKFLIGPTRSVASYLGLAEFCAAYGVDFRPLANELTKGYRENLLANEPRMSSAFSSGLTAGRQGMLYSVKAQRFLNLLESLPLPPRACQIAHQQVIQVSKRMARISKYPK